MNPSLIKHTIDLNLLALLGGKIYNQILYAYNALKCVISLWWLGIYLRLSLYLHRFYVCESSKRSGEAAYLHRQSEHGLIIYSISIRSHMSCPISLYNNHLLIKSSVRVLVR